MFGKTRQAWYEQQWMLWKKLTSPGVAATDGDPNARRTINLLQDGLSLPTVWRTNLAVDRKLPALGITLKRNPKWEKMAALILYATLGKALPEGAQSAAVLWMACQMYASKYAKEVARVGTRDEGAGLGGNGLFTVAELAGFFQIVERHYLLMCFQQVVHHVGKHGVAHIARS